MAQDMFIQNHLSYCSTEFNCCFSLLMKRHSLIKLHLHEQNTLKVQHETSFQLQLPDSKAVSESIARTEVTMIKTWPKVSAELSQQADIPCKMYWPLKKKEKMNYIFSYPSHKKRGKKQGREKEKARKANR